MHNDQKLRMIKQKDRRAHMLDDVTESQYQSWAVYLYIVKCLHCLSHH